MKSLERPGDSAVREPLEIREPVLLPHPIDDVPVRAVDTEENEWMNRRRVFCASTRHREHGHDSGKDNPESEIQTVHHEGSDSTIQKCLLRVEF